MSNQTTPLTELLSFVVDNRGKSVPTVKSGFPLIATNCIKHSSIYPTYENIRYVDQHIKNSWFRAHPLPNDIIFVNKGTPGRVCLVPDPVPFCFAQDMIGFRCDPDKIDYQYLFAVLRSNYIQELIKNYHVGLVIPHFKKGDLDKLLIPRLANRKQELSVGDFYLCLSKKIEINNRINAELEAMAKTLYDYWFVQFDFPDANGKPYKTSGGKMVYNATLKREIPAAWRTIRLNELLQNCADATVSGALDSNVPYTPIDMLPMKKMSFGDAYPSERANTSLIKYKKNDILIGAMRVYFHRVCIAPFDGITRTTTLVLRPQKKDFLPYIYQVCNEEKTINIAAKISVGTQQPYVNWENSLENLTIAYPEDDALIQRYSSAIGGIVKEVISREKESTKLKELRDWLLPLLMNGQVTVK